MANPQLEDGYTRIANEIMESLARNRLSGQERQVLDVLFRKTYGFNKREDQISMGQFSEMTGIARPKIALILKQLLSKKVIGVTKKDNSYINTYSFQKDSSLWQVLPKKITCSPKREHPVTKKDNESVTKKDTHKRNKDNIQKKGTFVPPTLDEVEAYCNERKNSVIPEKWLSHYQANGWKVGKNPMKDWKAAIRTWEEPKTRVPPMQSFDAAGRVLKVLP